MSEWHKRFHSHYSRGSDEDCWEWKSCRSAAGYGRFMLKGKSRIASRLAYQIRHGYIPDNICVLHQCDNPACVNPSHLWLGSHKENMDDRETKGRANGGSQRGESHPRAKLTLDLAQEIRRLALSNAMPQSAIARQFGISQSQVSEIKNAKAW